MRSLVLCLAPILLSLCCAGADAQGKAFLDEPHLPAHPFSYAVELPPHLASLKREEPENLPATDDARATLGRVLFHDRNLSRNGLVSCASCHSQAFGFDDPTRLSIGFQGRVTRRAAMTLVNVRFAKRGRFFRDERAASLEEQVLDPFTDPVEMGLAPGELAARIASRPFYAPLFAAAFGDAAIVEERVAAALAQYVRAIVSTRSRYDAGRALAGDALEPFAGFTTQENRGKTLFLIPREAGGAGCSACHEGEGFMLREPRSNGLPPGDEPDGGVGEITGLAADLGRFRTGTLRNIALTAPYMRDGRFATLDEVLEHYSGGVAEAGHPDPLLRGPDGRPARLQLSTADRDALIAFLETLTDEALVADERFSDPFRPR